MSIDQSHSVDGTPYPTSPPPAATDPNLSGDISLHESESKYQRLIEGISGEYVIYTHDPDGVITYVSPSIEPVLGFPREAIIGLNWRDLVGEHFIGREIADRVEDEVAEGKKFYKFTVEIADSQGVRRLVEIQQRPLFDAQGVYTSMEGIAKDITEITRNAEELQRLKDELEQRVAERTAALNRSNELLRASEARYRSVVDCQTEFVVRWMPEAIFTFVNEAFCRLVGRTSEDLIGWCFLPMIHPDDVPDFQQMLAGLNHQHPHSELESRVILPDGSVRWTLWTNSMLFDEGGEFLEFQSVGRDITELKHAADTIREKEAHLAHMSRLATMGELVSGMAHEIHQPLHAAKTFAEAARRNLEMASDQQGAALDEHIETAIDCAKEISNAIARTATIIRRLREFTHTQAVKFEELDLNRVVREASELVTFETRKARAKLVFDLDDELPIVQGDRIQLEQVCVNLLMNAYEAMADTLAEDRHVRISTRSHAQHVRISFRDTGGGVDVDDLDLLFDAFYSTKKQAMGMGLSLCKSIADTHGGRIWGKRNEGSGMSFVLELPKLLRPSSSPSNNG